LLVLSLLVNFCSHGIFIVYFSELYNTKIVQPFLECNWSFIKSSLELKLHCTIFHANIRALLHSLALLKYSRNEFKYFLVINNF
jgi:hypothetical protein